MVFVFQVVFFTLCLPRTSNMFDVARLPEYKDIEELIGNRENIDLWTVGMYIAAHKYFGVDVRYQAGNIEREDYIFYKQFPSPRLRNAHKGIVKACERNALACVKELVPVARKSGSLQNLMRRGGNLVNKTITALPRYAPFKSNYEDFRFRQTAMYYLCWHTLLKEKIMAFYTTRISCLEFLNYVHEVPRSTRAMIKGVAENIKNTIPRVVLDVRDMSKPEGYIYLCSRLWFCPDPCYGRKSGGNVTEYDPAKDPGNPCKDLPNSRCTWQKKGNMNLNDLIMNRFNVTCQCESKRQGFVWNNKFGICVDKDECYDNTHKCSFTRVCRNNVGSYSCTCPRGFQINEKTSYCDKVDILHDAVVILNVKEGLGSTPIDDNDIIDDFMELFGFSSGTVLSPIRLMWLAFLSLLFVH